MASRFIDSAGGGIVLAHDFEVFPPFENEGEEPADDPIFARECEDAIQVYLEMDPDIRIIRHRISINARFGPVCRADFETPNDGRDTVNRLMFWRLADGELVEFVGFEIPAPPLK